MEQERASCSRNSLNLLVRLFLSIILIVYFDCLIELVYVVYHCVGELSARLDYYVSIGNLEFDGHCQKWFLMLIYQWARGCLRLLMLRLFTTGRAVGNEY